MMVTDQRNMSTEMIKLNQKIIEKRKSNKRDIGQDSEGISRAEHLQLQVPIAAELQVRVTQNFTL